MIEKKKVDVICRTPVLENEIGINYNMAGVELPIGDIKRIIRRGNQVFEILPNGKRIFLTMDNVELDNSTRTIGTEYVVDSTPVKDGRSIEQAIHNSGKFRKPRGPVEGKGDVQLDPGEQNGPGHNGGEHGGVNVPPHEPSIPKNKDTGGDPTPDPGTPGGPSDPTPDPPLGVDGGIDEDANNASGDGKQGKKNQDDDGHTEIG